LVNRRKIAALSVVILTFFTISNQAQTTFSFQRTDPFIVYDSLNAVEILNHGVLTNLTSNPFDVTVRITYNLPSGWQAGVCTWILCYGTGVDSITNTCQPGQNNMYAYFYPDHNTMGAGYLTINIKRVSNPSENYTVQFGASTAPVGIKKLSNTVESFSLDQNYPNPFNPSTKIGFSIPKTDYVDLRVYDILGREVSVLLSQQLNAGEYEIEFDGKNLSSGMYYYRLQSGDNVWVKKMTLVK
jgi:hypothetical protein